MFLAPHSARLWRNRMEYWNYAFGWIYQPLVTVGDTEITLARIGALVFMLLAVWWFSSILERTLRRIALHGNRAHMTSSTVYAFTRLVRYIVWIVGTIIGLNFMGFDLTSLAFLGGAIGVGIGFGLQNIFQNFISGIIILVEKTLKVGDFVEIESGVRGTVAEIGMRYTRISTNDDVDVLVPNSEFINKPVTNWTYGDRTRRIGVKFGLDPGRDQLHHHDPQHARSGHDAAQDAALRLGDAGDRVPAAPVAAGSRG